MKTIYSTALSLLFSLSGCLTAEESFVGGRLLDPCDGLFYICNVPASCVLDEDHYTEGIFPGARRVSFTTEDPNQTLRIRLYFSSMIVPGTEFLLQVYESSCSVNKQNAQIVLQDIDIFDEAGDDRALIYEILLEQQGDHLIELFSDSVGEYLLVVELLE